MFKKILLAYDGSAHSQRAVECAKDVASKYGASIVLLHAYSLVPIDLGSPYVEQVQIQVISASEKIVKEAQDKLASSGIAVTTEIVQGPPAEAILRQAQTHGCDLIVLGSRGFGELKAALLGSVSDKVLHHSTIPVLVVK